MKGSDFDINVIDGLKNNWLPFGRIKKDCYLLFRRELIEWLQKNDPHSLLRYTARGEWMPMYGLANHNDILRLKDYWTPPKEQAEWKYFNVYLDEGSYYCYNDGHKLFLDTATCKKGFDSVEFKEWPDTWFSETALWIDENGDHRFVSGNSFKPATPNRIRIRKDC